MQRCKTTNTMTKLEEYLGFLLKCSVDIAEKSTNDTVITITVSSPDRMQYILNQLNKLVDLEIP